MNGPVDAIDPDDVVGLLLGFVEFGRTITVALEAVADDPELAHNSSLLTLSVLHLEGPQRPGHLQDRTALTSGGVTKLLARLEEQGLVQRRKGVFPEDGRAVQVAITDVGTTQLRRLVTEFTNQLPQIESFNRDVTRLVTGLRQLAGVA